MLQVRLSATYSGNVLVILVTIKFEILKFFEENSFGLYSLKDVAN